MKKFMLYTILGIATLTFCGSNVFAGSKKSKGWRPTRDRSCKTQVTRQGYGLYLGVTPIYDISPRRQRFFPHILPHFHIGSHNPRYHHRGDVLLPNYGVGVGVGIRYGVFRSRNLGLGIHIR